MLWVVLLLVISASSFLIHGIRMWGPWSPIHILSVLTPIMLIVGVLAARGHHVRTHRITMISIFAGALVHAQRGVRPVAIALRKAHSSGEPFFGLEQGRFPGLGGEHGRPRKSLEKRREKPVRQTSFGVVRRPSIRYMIRIKN